jgi:hypothetical protein
MCRVAFIVRKVASVELKVRGSDQYEADWAMVFVGAEPKESKAITRYLVDVEAPIVSFANSPALGTDIVTAIASGFVAFGDEKSSQSAHDLELTKREPSEKLLPTVAASEASAAPPSTSPSTTSSAASSASSSLASTSPALEYAGSEAPSTRAAEAAGFVRVLVRSQFALVRRAHMVELQRQSGRIQSCNDLVAVTANWHTKTPYLTHCEICLPWSIAPLVAYATVLMSERAPC